MFPIPSIQIRQQFAKIGFDADLGAYEIKQPQASVNITRVPAALDIRSPQGELRIDQSKAFDALGIGNHFDWMQRIYEGSKSAVIQGIGRIVQQGDRMAAIHFKENPIPAIAWENAFETSHGLNYIGEASYNNVSVQYIEHKPEIHFEPASVEVDIKPNKPEIHYIAGKYKAYMEQYNSIEIIPPQIDIRK